jgi:hypothetical protein
MIWKTTRVISLAKSFAIVLLAAGCSGGGNSSSEGVSVSFDASHSAELTPQPAGPRTFVNTEGVTITLTEAYLVLWSEEIFNDCDGSYVRLQPSWLDWLIPTAEAHASNSPTRQGIPYVIDITAADDSLVTLGTTNPPPDDYCGMEIILRAADADTLLLPTDIDMVGHALYLEGSYQTSGMSTPTAFTLSTSRSLLPARRYLLPPLSLSEQSPTATTSIMIHYERWFNGLDLALLIADDDTQTEMLLQNISDAIEVTWR